MIDTSAAGQAEDRPVAALIRGHERAALDQLGEWIRERSDRPVRVTSVKGSPSWEIVKAAKKAGRIAAGRNAPEGKVWIRIFPHKSISKKPAETRQGSGKGDVDYWAAVVKPGTILYEIDGVSEDIAREALRLVEKVREREEREFCLLLHGDATYGIPDGDGMMEFSCRLMDDPQGLKDEADRRVDQRLTAAERFKAQGLLDGWALCSDYCFNNGPFMSPAQFAEFVRKRLHRALLWQRSAPRPAEKRSTYR